MVCSAAGTVIQEGGAPIKYRPGGKEIELPSPPRESREFNGRGYVMEMAIKGGAAAGGSADGGRVPQMTDALVQEVCQHAHAKSGAAGSATERTARARLGHTLPAPAPSSPSALPSAGVQATLRW
jgi:hypothetical protein